VTRSTDRNDVSDEQETGPREECGVFGVWAPGEDVAKLTYFGLYALQHRGQEAAGIAVSDGRRIMREDMSPVAAEGEYPMRYPSSEKVITRNKNKGHVCEFTGPT